MPTLASQHRSGSSPTRTPPTRPGRLASQQAATGAGPVVAGIAARAAAQRQTAPGWSPVRALLNAASFPGYLIGDAIRHPEHLIPGHGINVGEIYNNPKYQVFPGQALRERGALNVVPEAFGMRATAAFAGDVFLDPTTYLTFGAGAGAKAATTVASRGLMDATRAAVARGERVSFADVARASATRETALAAAPRAVSVGFRVPFTRGKVIPIAESKLAARAGAKVASAIGDRHTMQSLREVFLPAGSGSKAAHRIGMDVRRYGDAEKHALSQEASRFQAKVAKTAKAAGMSPKEAFPAIVRSLDQPGKYPIPAALAGLKNDAAGFLDHLRSLEDTAGVDRGLVPDYVPHLPADSSTRRALQQRFPGDPNRPLFFQHQRELPNLDAWDAAGLKPEMNIAKLLEVRGHASVDARVMKAFDNAVADVPGIHTTDVQRVKDMIRPSISGTAGVVETKRFVNAVGSSWKALALLSPGYHARNMQSDLVSAYWGGARNPRSFVQAAHALLGRAGKVKTSGETYTSKEIVALAESAGAIRIGQAGKEIHGELAQSGGLSIHGRGFRPSRPGKGRAARGSQAVGSAREDFVRLGLFIERLKAGDDVMTAAKVTRDFLYDYGDVGKFVGAARKFWLPFMTFGTKAVPMVGRQAVQHPGTLANLNKTTSALNQAAGSPDLSLLPLGSRSSFAVPVPGFLRSVIGAPEGQPLMFNPESVLAYGALNNFDPVNAVRSVMGYANPIPKAAIENATKHSFYFDSSTGPRVGAPSVINALHDAGVPIPGYGPKRVSYPPGSPDVPGYSRALDNWLRVLPLYGQQAPLVPGGASETTRMPFLRYLAGLSISPYDQSKAAYYAQKYGNR